MSDIIRFLRERGVAEGNLMELKEEKVDAETVTSIDDITLARFVPKLGDRIALRNFCHGQQKPSRQKQGKRAHLFDVLRRKLNKTGANESVEECKDQIQSKEEANKKCTKCRKTTRKIEIGWIHNGKQVRKRTGGGTRKLDILRSAQKPDLLTAGKQLFFPEGLSTKGPVTDFTFDLLDFKEIPLPDNVTISECYERFKTGILTFYLHSEEKDTTTGKGAHAVVLDASDDELPNILAPGPEPAKEADVLILDSPQTDGEKSSTTEQEPLPSINQIDILAEAAVAIGELPLESYSLPDSSDNEIFFNFERHQHRESEPEIPSTLPRSSMEMTIHRGPMAFNELCGYFKDPSILSSLISITRVLPNADKERAEDVGGVLKDTLTEFWEDFYSKCTIGRDVKVPCLRHDFGDEEWQAVGRILKYGWDEIGYWPIALSKVFMTHCIFPQNVIKKSELLTDFYGFTAVQDQEIFETAVNDFSGVDEDDLLEALNSYECKTKVTAENFVAVMHGIAHKEILHTLMFVCNCWRGVLKELSLNQAKLNDIYTSLLPTNKKVGKLLNFPTANSVQDEEIFRFLKRYVKELGEQKLRAFLRFCTGSDVLNTSRISVELIPMKEFERRPIGHTCGCLLQLGNAYGSFMEFRSEFDGVLESKVWIMDVV